MEVFAITSANRFLRSWSKLQEGQITHDALAAIIYEVFLEDLEEFCKNFQHTDASPSSDSHERTC